MVVSHPRLPSFRGYYRPYLENTNWWNLDLGLPHIPHEFIISRMVGMKGEMKYVVTDLNETDGKLFVCEFCGAGYENIETAENCEEHCATLGFTSADIRRKAVHIPKIQVIPMY